MTQTRRGLPARERLLERVRQEWSGFQDSLASLPEEGYLESGVVGQWSLRDLLVHVASWEEEALKAIPIILEGGRLPRYSALYGGIDAFNAQVQEAKRGLSLTEARAELEATHQRLLSCLEQLPDHALASGGRLARRLRQDTFNHYREHAGHVATWRRQRAL